MCRTRTRPGGPIGEAPWSPVVHLHQVRTSQPWLQEEDWGFDWSGQHWGTSGYTSSTSLQQYFVPPKPCIRLWITVLFPGTLNPSQIAPRVCPKFALLFKSCLCTLSSANFILHPSCLPTAVFIRSSVGPLFQLSFFVRPFALWFT